jgi:hypothetical protein
MLIKIFGKKEKDCCKVEIKEVQDCCDTEVKEIKEDHNQGDACCQIQVKESCCDVQTTGCC